MADATRAPLLFVCTHHAEEPERATVPFIAAATAAVSGHHAIVVCTIDGAHNGTTRHTEVESEGMPALADLVRTLVDNGGEIWVCSACATVRSITGDDTIEGATIVGAATIVEALANGTSIALG